MIASDTMYVIQHRVPIRLALAVALLLSISPAIRAQISLTTAVDLALRSNPRVQGAQADVRRAAAQVSQAHDVYVPSINAGAGIGQSYGYSTYPPTLFSLNAGSLVYSSAQFSYIRSAMSGVNAARLTLEDVQEAVAQDAALAFVALDHDQQRESVYRQESGFANALVAIVQQRLDAGQDTQIDLTQARLTVAQLHLAALKAEDDTAVDREHLARLIDMPPAALTVDGSFLTRPLTQDAPADSSVRGYANSAVASAFASADARQKQAQGDTNFLFRPQISLVAQYNRYATFSNSFAQLQKVYQFSSGQTTTLGADEGVFGVQITIPLLDKSRAAKARESQAEAARALHDAQSAQIDALDGQSRLRRTLTELQAQADVADLQQQYAQQQLDILHLQMQTGNGNPDAPQMTPKDEQKARIAERDKYLGVIDSTFQLRQAEIQLLRQTGQLEAWLKSAIQSNIPAAPTPQP